MPSGRQFVKYLWAPAVAAGVFWLAYDQGSYTLTSRNSIAVVVLWTIVLASAAGFWPAARVPGPALVSGSLLGAFALWTGLSALWAASAEKAFDEFDRVLLFLAIFALAVVASPRGSARRWLAGLALGLTAVGVIALMSRLFPHSFEAPAELAQSFPTASKRLSFPVDYWNGLATLVAFAIPCLLYFAAEARAAVRGLAVAPLPALTATLYLTSSRGGWVAAGIAIVVLMALTSWRWATAGARRRRRRLGGGGGCPACPGRARRLAAQSSVAESQGRSAALLIALLLPRGWSRIRAPPDVVPVSAAGEPGRLDCLRRRARHGRGRRGRGRAPRAGARQLQGDPAGADRGLRSGAPLFDERQRPLAVVVLGGRRIPDRPMWARRGFLRGVVGRARVDPCFRPRRPLPLSRDTGRARPRRPCSPARVLRLLPGHRRTAAARPDGGRAGGGRRALRARVRVSLRGWDRLDVGADGRFGGRFLRARPSGGPRRGAGALGAGRRPNEPEALPASSCRSRPRSRLALIVAEAIPLLATMEVRRSQEPRRRGDVVDGARPRGVGTEHPALGGHSVSPARPRPGARRADRGRARRDRNALPNDDADWRLWLVAARIQTKAGDIAAARQSLAKARELNPKSQLFAG